MRTSRFLPFPLPPFAEQHRIVAKVDELMGLCDRLEAAKAGVRDARPAGGGEPRPPQHARSRQISGACPLRAGRAPGADQRPDQIKQLRQTILTLAVRGKLWIRTTAKAGIGTWRSSNAPERLLRREQLRPQARAWAFLPDREHRARRKPFGITLSTFQWIAFESEPFQAE